MGVGDLLGKIGVEKYPRTHPDGTGNLMGIWANMFASQQKGSTIKWVEAPRDVYRFMQHPEYAAAKERGVNIEVIFVQTDCPKQETFLRAIIERVDIVRAYDDRLHEINRVVGLNGVINYIQDTWNFVFQGKTEDLDFENSRKLALDWRDEFFPDGNVSYKLDLKTP